MKSNALFITARVFFSGKCYEVANPSSGLQGWSSRRPGRGNNSALGSSVSQGKRRIHEKWMFKNGLLANHALQSVTSACIMPASFPPCPALLGLTEHSQSFRCPGTQSLPSELCAALTGITAIASLFFKINPSSPTCWPDNVSIHREKSKINHIAACRMGKEFIPCLLPWHYRINRRIFLLNSVWNCLFRSCRIPWNYLDSTWVLLYLSIRMKNIVLVCMLHNPHDFMFLVFLYHLKDFPAWISPFAQCCRSKTSLAPLENSWATI